MRSATNPLGIQNGADDDFKTDDGEVKVVKAKSI